MTGGWTPDHNEVPNVLIDANDPNFFQRVSQMRDEEFPGTSLHEAIEKFVFDQDVVEGEIVSVEDDPFDGQLDIDQYDIEQTPIFKALYDQAELKPESVAAELATNIAEADLSIRRSLVDMEQAVAAI